MTVAVVLNYSQKFDFDWNLEGIFLLYFLSVKMKFRVMVVLFLTLYFMSMYWSIAELLVFL